MEQNWDHGLDLSDENFVLFVRDVRRVVIFVKDVVKDGALAKEWTLKCIAFVATECEHDRGWGYDETERVVNKFVKWANMRIEEVQNERAAAQH